MNISRLFSKDKHKKLPLEIATLLFWFSLYTYPSVFSPYLKELKISTGMIGLILGSYGMSQLFLRLPLGILSDRLRDRKSFILLGIFVSSVSAFGLFTFKQAPLIFLSRLLAGVAASSWVTFSVLYSSYFDQKDSSKAISRIFIFQSTGTMLAMFVGGLVAEQYGWKMPFVVGGGVALIALGFAVFIKDDNRHKKGNITKEANITQGDNTTVSPITMQELIAVMKDPTLIAVSLLAILLQFNSTATVLGFTPIYAGNIGATKLQLGILTFFSQLPVIIASIIGSRGVYTKIGEKKTICIAFFIMAIFSGIIPLIKTINLLYATQFIAGFCRGVLTPVLMGLGIKSVPASKRATAMGAFQAIYSIGMVLGPTVFGVIAQATQIWVGFLLAGTIALVGVVVAQITLKTQY